MKLSIMQKMLAFILMPVLVGLAAVTLLNYNAARTAMNTQIAEELQLVLHGQKNELANTVTLLGSALGNFASDADVLDFLRAKANSAARPNELARLEQRLRGSILRLSKGNALLRDVGLVDRAGKVLVHSSQDLTGASVADHKYFQAALHGEIASVTITSKADDTLTSALGLPVRDGDTIIGVVYATMQLEELARTTTDTVHIAQTGKCFVYDKYGKLLMHPNKKYIGDEDGNLPWTRHMLDSPGGRYDYEWTGIQMMGYFDHVPLVNWLIIVSVNEDDILAPINAMFWQSVLVAGLAMLAVGLIIVLVARDIAQVLKRTATLVEKIARGELCLSPAEEQALTREGMRGDEIGGMARGIRGMLEGLRRLFRESEQKSAEARAAAGQLESVVNIVSSASAELSAQIEESERGAERQAERVAETATSMEEMNATVLEVARNAGAAADVSMATREKAEAGAAIVEKSVVGIRKVQEQSLALKQNMIALSENAQSIGRVMSVISDIADQTNLLALNAAIEAARAGDAGRGFSVVADEVRKLAEKSMNATSQVSRAIEDIQTSTTRSMEQVDSAATSIAEATELANQSGAALSEIVGMVDKTADQVRAIATASEQQSASSEAITASIGQVNSIASETARAMDRAAKAMTELAAQSQTLNNLIGEMKRN